VSGKIFGPNRDDVHWKRGKRIPNGRCYDFCFLELRRIIRFAKSKMMSWTGHETRGNNKKLAIATEFYSENMKGKTSLET
jgi:hypothetical protein